MGCSPRLLLFDSFGVGWMGERKFALAVSWWVGLFSLILRRLDRLRIRDRVLRLGILWRSRFCGFVFAFFLDGDFYADDRKCRFRLLLYEFRFREQCYRAGQYRIALKCRRSARLYLYPGSA